jgi:hypothetical protein
MAVGHGIATDVRGASRPVPGARVKIYPDSAHGSLFQHHAEFAADVDAFPGGRSGAGGRIFG